MSTRIVLVAVVIANIAGTRAQADQITMTSFKDNTIVEPMNDGPNSGALTDSVFAGKTGFLGNQRLLRALMMFDLSKIPAGSKIENVTLTLQMLQTVSGDHSVELRRASADWGEGTSMGSGGIGAPATTGDATWFHTFFNTQFWKSPGGDFALTTSAIATVGQPGPYAWSSAEMIADVQFWVDNPGQNFGWFILGNENEAFSAKRFGSKDHAMPEMWPALQITYTPLSACEGDIVADGTVNVDDLLAVINAWGDCPDPPKKCPADVDGGGSVNVDDLLAVINNWGDC